MTRPQALTEAELKELRGKVQGFVCIKGLCDELWRPGEVSLQAEDVSAHEARSLVVCGEPASVLFDCSQHDCGPQMAAAVCAMRNAMPALLDMAHSQASEVERRKRCEAILLLLVGTFRDRFHDVAKYMADYEGAE